MAAKTSKEVASYTDIPAEYTEVVLAKLDGFIKEGNLVIKASLDI